MGKARLRYHESGRKVQTFFQWDFGRRKFLFFYERSSASYLHRSDGDRFRSRFGADRGFTAWVCGLFYLWGREITAEEVSRVASRAVDGTPL